MFLNATTDELEPKPAKFVLLSTRNIFHYVFVLIAQRRCSVVKSVLHNGLRLIVNSFNLFGMKILLPVSDINRYKGYGNKLKQGIGVGRLMEWQRGLRRNAK